MHKFTMPAENFDELNINKTDILHLIQKHLVGVARLKKLKRYYEGLHDIEREENRKIRLVCNHAKDIADTASSYFIGNPVSYSSNKLDITELANALDYAGADEADGDNGIDLSIYGRAYEYLYTKENKTDLAIKNITAEHTFIVYDDTIEENELFGVYYYAKIDDTDKNPVRYIATVTTKNYIWQLTILGTENPQEVTEQPKQHFLDEVPIIEYFNNKLALGDYELQIPLIDAYNTLMSDRVTDKEQFIDAILVIYGTMLSDDGGDEEEAAMKKLKEEKLMEIPDGTKAEYLTRTFDEAGVEILRKAIEQDIHKFSHIPCLTDDSFAGNISGVAMEYKLLGLENITKIKSRYYKKGLRKRLQIFENFLSKKGLRVETKLIDITFTRALPKNVLELSQIVANLSGKVSLKTLLSQLPFVKDVDAEIEAVKRESDEAAARQSQMFGNQMNLPPDDVEEEADE